MSKLWSRLMWLTRYNITKHHKVYGACHSAGLGICVDGLPKAWYTCVLAPCLHQNTATTDGIGQKSNQQNTAATEPPQEVKCRRVKCCRIRLVFNSRIKYSTLPSNICLWPNICSRNRYETLQEDRSIHALASYFKPAQPKALATSVRNHLVAGDMVAAQWHCLLREHVEQQCFSCATTCSFANWTKMAEHQNTALHPQTTFRGNDRKATGGETSAHVLFYRVVQQSLTVLSATASQSRYWISITCYLCRFCICQNMEEKSEKIEFRFNRFRYCSAVLYT